MLEGLPERDIRHALTELATPDTWRLEGPVIRSRQCDIFRAQSPDFPSKVAIKKYHSTELRAVEIQYQALVSYRSLSGDQNGVFTVPQPYGYLPQHGLVLMEWVDAPTLWRRLWGTLGRPTARRALLRRTGAWLRRFHEHGGVETGEISTAHYRQKIVTILAKSNAAKKKLEEDPIFKSALNLLLRHEGLLKHKSFACAPLHGDFTPSNVLLSATGRVTGIDIWARRQGPVAEDIARMIIYLCVIFPFSGGGRMETQALLEGYGKDMVDAGSDCFNYILLYQYFQRWIRLADRTRGLPYSILDQIALARVKRNVAVLCKLPAFQR